MPSSQPIYLFTALACEAKPFIDCFKLKKRHDLHVFSVYQKDNIHLIVTGIGQPAMAAGVAYLLALSPPSTLPILINIGVAGHKEYAVGSLFIADKIINAYQAKCYYPQLVAKIPCDSANVMTVLQVEEQYLEPVLYDMEAAAFYEIASRFSSQELIHCFKVISDNQHTEIKRIKPAHISEWIYAARQPICDYIQALTLLAQACSSVETPYYAELIQQQHFTHNEKIQLKSLLAKRAILKPLDDLNVSTGSGADILKSLNAELLAHPFGGF